MLLEVQFHTILMHFLPFASTFQIEFMVIISNARRRRRLIQISVRKVILSVCN